MGVNCITAGVQEIERAMEGVAVLTNDERHSAVIDFGYVSAWDLQVQLKFSMVKICVVVVYGPTEGEVEEKEKFWNDLEMVVDIVGNGYRLCVR